MRSQRIRHDWACTQVLHTGSPVAKTPHSQCRGPEFEAWSGKRQWHPTPVLLPGKSRGQRSLVGCSPWGHKESDTTERLPFHFSLSCIGEGNGNPLQCSCLENPRDSGVWWAAVYVYGVAQSWTWLKRLSSSRSIYKSNIYILNFSGGYFNNNSIFK